MRTHASPADRPLTRVARAVVSLLVLAAVLAGLPVLLAWASPVIWEATHDDLAHLLDRQDTGSAFLMLLLAAGWAGWAQFAFCAVRELFAQVRGYTWQVPRGFGASQRTAAALIGSILVLLPTSSALASDAQAAPGATAARLPGEQQPAGTAQPVSRAHSAASSRTVQPGESLWSIAERELGDGERWREIAALNEGRTMADGQTFQSNSFLRPGWQLRMPSSTPLPGGDRTQLSGPAEAGTGTHVVTVDEGDHLSKIAEEELGDSTAWPQLFDASRGKPQPDGLPALTDPNVIHAGQQITVPGPSGESAPPDDSNAPGTGGSAASPPAPSAPDDNTAGAPVPRRSAPPEPETPAPGTSDSPPAEQPSNAPSAASSSARAQTPSTAAPSPTTAAEAPVASPAAGVLNLRTVLGAGALLAAAVTGALALRRTLQRRRRKPGETIAIAEETSSAEARMAAAAEPAGAARLDAALRTMAHQAARQDSTVSLPVVRAARIGARTVHVLPEDPAQEPRAPFVRGKEGWWDLDSAAVLLDEDAARDVPAPYPGLVTIGSTGGGDLVLLNLARMSAVLLDGNPVHITEVCTSLAVELGMSPWAGDVEIVTVGFGEDLPQLLPTARIAHMRQAAHALRDLSERLLEVHQLPETEHQPYLLLCASSLDADTAWQFADVIDKAGTLPVTLIAPASTAAAHFPEAEILNASLSDPQHLDCAGVDITVQRLEHEAYLQIATALKVSGQPPHPAEGPWQNVPGEPDKTQQPEQPSPAEPSASAAPTAPAVSPVAPPDTSSGAFPALLAASSSSSSITVSASSSTDPSALPALPTGKAAPAADNDPNPPAEAVAPSPAPVPAAPATTATTAGHEAPQTDDHEASHEEEEHEAPKPEEPKAHDLHAPEIRVLGPVEVTGVDSTGHGPRMAQLAALLYFRPGRSADVLCADMDPVTPWSPSTLNARLQGLRRSLGNDPAGNPYVPRRRSADTPYQLAPAVRCDWTRFLHLVEHALPLGTSGLPDLEKALTLVRGRPFGGKALPWAEPYQQEMITRIIDVAHTVATYRTPAGPHHDLSAARRAVATGLDVDDTAELLYRDWLRIEHAARNRQGLHTAISRVQQINRALDCSLETETTQLINELLNDPGAAARKAL